MKIEAIKISLLNNNTGQIAGLPKNPRFIRNEKYEKLKKSIEDDPEMLQLRELIVCEHEGQYVVIGGNMRLRAMKELGYTEAPCKVLPEGTDAEKLKAYTIKDNTGYGQDDWDALANDWDVEQLTDWGMDLPDLGVEVDDSEEDEKEEVFTIVLEYGKELEAIAAKKQIEEIGLQCRIK